MNRFRFRLESVLRVRGAEEEARKRAFGAARQEAQREENLLNEIHREIEEHDRITEDREKMPLNARDMAMHHGYSRQLERERELQQSRLKRAEEMLDTRRNELIEATRRKKTLDHLRERALQEHAQAENKEEQAILDELTVQKYKPEPSREE